MHPYTCTWGCLLVIGSLRMDVNARVKQGLCLPLCLFSLHPTGFTLWTPGCVCTEGSTLSRALIHMQHALQVRQRRWKLKRANVEKIKVIEETDGGKERHRDTKVWMWRNYGGESKQSSGKCNDRVGGGVNRPVTYRLLRVWMWAVVGHCWPCILRLTSAVVNISPPTPSKMDGEQCWLIMCSAGQDMPTGATRINVTGTGTIQDIL